MKIMATIKTLTVTNTGGKLAETTAATSMGVGVFVGVGVTVGVGSGVAV